MSAAASTDDDFINLWRVHSSPTEVARILGVTVRRVHHRRHAIEKRLGITLASADDQSKRGTNEPTLPKKGVRREVTITGNVVVFSDAHFWPGDQTPAFKALLEVLKDLKPAMVIANGDVLDGSRISRHDRIGWENRPTLKDELEACRESMDAIRQASRRSRHLWNLGNHCIRFARYLANNVPEMEGIPGSELSDHIRHWDIGWSVAVNGHTMVKHRQQGGVHASYNNTLRSGWSMVTGHLHRLLVTPWADYNGVRFGVDTGTLGNIGPEVGQWFYTEDAPLPWSSGFAVLTFTKDGRLIEPELCRVIGGVAYFRGGKVV